MLGQFRANLCLDNVPVISWRKLMEKWVRKLFNPVAMHLLRHPWDWQYVPFNFYLLSINAFYKAPSSPVLKEDISCRESTFYLNHQGESTFIVVATLEKGKEKTMLASTAAKAVSSQVLTPQRICAKLVVYSKTTKLIHNATRFKEFGSFRGFDKH